FLLFFTTRFHDEPPSGRIRKWARASQRRANAVLPAMVKSGLAEGCDSRIPSSCEVLSGRGGVCTPHGPSAARNVAPAATPLDCPPTPALVLQPSNGEPSPAFPGVIRR